MYQIRCINALKYGTSWRIGSPDVRIWTTTRAAGVKIQNKVYLCILIYVYNLILVYFRLPASAKSACRPRAAYSLVCRCVPSQEVVHVCLQYSTERRLTVGQHDATKKVPDALVEHAACVLALRVVSYTVPVRLPWGNFGQFSDDLKNQLISFIIHQELF
jgi:hypothetical protein